MHKATVGVNRHKKRMVPYKKDMSNEILGRIAWRNSSGFGFHSSMATRPALGLSSEPFHDEKDCFSFQKLKVHHSELSLSKFVCLLRWDPCSIHLSLLTMGSFS